jgi:hypothetical protein
VRVDGAFIALVADALDDVQQVEAGVDPSGRGDERGQDVEFGGGEVHERVAHFNGAAVAIQHDIRRFQYFCGGFLLPCAAQDGAHARHQFARTEGFGHVVVRAHLQADHFLLVVHAGGEQDDGSVVLRAMPAHELIPVHLGHHHVEDDKVGFLFLRHGQSLLAIVRGHHADSLPAQDSSRPARPAFFRRPRP